MSNNSILILIAGGHASGKKLACELIRKDVSSRFSKVILKEIDMNDYVNNVKDESSLRNPSRFDFSAIKQEVSELQQTADMIIVHGLYALYDKQLNDQATVKIFIDSDADIRLGRWIKRDILEPSKLEPTLKNQESAKLKGLLTTYLNRSRVEMNQFIFQTKVYADVILPRGAESTGISLIVDGIQPLLNKNEPSTTHNSTLQEKSESRETVQHNLRNNVTGPTVSSLNSENFSIKNGRFYDLN